MNLMYETHTCVRVRRFSTMKKVKSKNKSNGRWNTMR